MDVVTDGGSNDNPQFDAIPRIVEIEVPNDSAIFFYKAALKAGVECLEDGKRLFVLAGDDVVVSRIGNAINALTVLIDTVRDVEIDIVKDYQDWQQQLNHPQSVDVGFAPCIENDGDEL